MAKASALAFVESSRRRTAKLMHFRIPLWFSLLLLIPTLFASAAEGLPNVTLLVPGIEDPIGFENGNDHWAEIPGSWKPLADFLTKEGHTFGGVIRPKQVHIHLPESLDASDHDARRARNADFFFLDFSRPADADGLAFRSLELAEAVVELRKFTGKRVTILAHSAGGLVARVVLQRACPGIPQESQESIDRLITIGTPHFGAALATGFGDLFGTRVTSLKPDAGLIQRLNSIALPTGVCYTAIIVRSVGSDVRSPGRAYDGLIDLPRLQEFPAAFHTGGDEIVHVRSQNMSLIPQVRELEERSRRAVQSILVLVPPRSAGLQADPLQTVHVTALGHPELLAWTARLLADDGGFWTPKRSQIKEVFIDSQVRVSIQSAIEHKAIAGRPLRQVSHVRLETLEVLADRHSYRFRGKAFWKELFHGETTVQGDIEVELDEFSRLIGQRVGFASVE
jgi:pimeloyl-ACP methyl ester carboxylesterase